MSDIWFNFDFRVVLCVVEKMFDWKLFSGKIMGCLISQLRMSCNMQFNAEKT
jgi:hypothetical protein